MDHLESELPDEMSRDRVRDRLLYLVSLVTDPRHCRSSADYWRPLSASRLDEVVGEIDGRAAYADLLGHLRRAGVLEVYTRGGKETYVHREGGTGESKRYRCAWSGWQTSPRKVYHLLTLKVKKGKGKAKKGAPPELVEGAPEDPLTYLQECFFSRTTFDVPRALSVILRLVGADPAEAECDYTDADYARLSRLCAGSERAQAALAAVWAGWRSGEAEVVRDTYGRVHGPVSNLWGALRGCLRLDGDPDLVSLDIRASQLVFAAAWMQKAGPVWHRKDAPLPEDWQRWLALVQSREVDVYSECYRLVHGREPTSAERGQWKEEFFGGWWYAIDYWQSESPIGQVLAREFPSVHEFVHSRKTTPEGKHAAFPVQLQRQESKCMIDDLVPRLRAAGVPTLTIHDSVIVRRCHLDTAMRHMRAALDAHLGGVEYVVRVESVPEVAAAKFAEACAQ